jgi:O-antigen/teichoic acid export membrane protein
VNEDLRTPARPRLAWPPRLGRLGRIASYTTIGLGARAVVQAVYLVVLSRWLGPTDYGLFSGSLVAATLLAPLSGWGMIYILSREAARDRAAARMWLLIALLRTLTSGAALAAIVVAASYGLALRIDSASMVMLAVSELVVLPGAQVTGRAFVVLDQALNAALSICVVPAFRVVAVFACIALGVAATPASVATAHCIGSIVGLLVVLAQFAAANGIPGPYVESAARGLFREGTAFALGAFVMIAYPELDKVLVLQLTGPADAADYTVAFRLVSVLVLPVTALVNAALPSLFAAGAADRQSKLTHVAASAASFGVLAALLCLLVAPAVPLVFGAAYAPATTLLRLLAPWPLVYALHQCAALALTSGGLQKWRVLIEAAGIVLIVVLDVNVLPTFGVQTAALVLIGVEILMAFACWCLYVWRKGQRCADQTT